jgi:hypothetical protein
MGRIFVSVFRIVSLLYAILFFASPVFARPSDCLFEVDGQQIINGTCQFVVGRGGSFRIFTLRGAGIEYVAEVNRVGSAQALGAWNGQRGDLIPRITLGVLMPSGACWTNARVRLCAWRWGEPRYFAEAPPAASLPPSPSPLPTPDTSQVPTSVGMCVQTQIASLGSRLDGAPDSGSAVSYANNISGVSYEIVEAVRSSRVGDPVTLCLVSVPQDCPKGDDRGKVYSATNLRTKQGWSLPDAEHMCGGA